MRLYTRCFLIFLFTLFNLNNATAQDELEEIVVTAHPLSEGGLAQSLTVLSGEELNEKVQGSLGETISKEAGINSASFGSAVGRPIIHGLSGTRVKTTEDRIDTMDASVTSGDHAVTIEPFIANQINILKGASTLLYGSSAIGGVVDVETGRIARELPNETLSGKFELRAADNADATTGAARLDGTISDNLVWHVDAFARDADDYEIPGFAESTRFRALEELEEHDDEHEEEHEGEEHEEEHEDEHAHDDEEARDILEGSRSESKGGAFGLSFVGDSGFAGFSVSTIASDYGLVGGHEHGHEEEEEEHHDEEEEHEGEEHHDEEEHEEEEEGVGVIDLDQTRFDFEAQTNNPFAGVESINFRFGINDYEHAEIEGNGEIGTLFSNEAWEGRVLLTHEPIGGFEGSFGLQLNNREFSALGEEAFVPPVETDSVGLFWVGQRDFDQFNLELGARFESLEHNPSLATLEDQDFSTASASLGVIFPFSDQFSLAALIDYSGRAPSIEELYSDGPHLATQSFEIGDPNLEEETALGISVTADYQTGNFDFSATAYHMSFDDFIYEANTGEELDELPVFVYQQDDATFTGLDAKANIHLASIGSNDLDLTLLFDTVSATLDNSANVNRNLPRIPASRYGAGLEWRGDVWDATINYLRVDDQNDTADFELATDGYDDVSIFLNRNITLSSIEMELFLHGRNLTDDEQRRHASIVKDVAPAPGRRFEVGVRFQF